MTSRVSFYKIMREDLRHKTWMVALSCLASFLAMPILFLLSSTLWNNRIDHWHEYYVDITWDIMKFKQSCMTEFFMELLPISVGIVLVVGALIVGLFGFRHVFSKRMTDLYQSIPVKRKDLFLAQYINGFLIWFIPMLVGMILCAVFAVVFMGNAPDKFVYIFKPLAVGLCNYVLSFLLIYNVTIVAVMLSGNILNTLVNGAILNFLVLFGYGMIEVFKIYFYDTYYSFAEETVWKLLWTSPISSAIYQLVMFVTDQIKAFATIMNVIVVVILFAAAFVLYLRRASELAEQGMKNKVVGIVFKTCMTVFCAMAGWIFFRVITDIIAWHIFGAILLGTLCYGILDIVFTMDFKAFFAHKLHLAVSVACAIFIGCFFTFDWSGYDTYLPEQDEIKEIGICVSGMGFSRLYSDAYDGILNPKNCIDQMSYTNQETAYQLLKEMTTKEYSAGGFRTMYVRVTQTNGKTYYRLYNLSETQEQFILPILEDESYIKTNVCIPEKIIEDVLDEEKQKSIYINGFYGEAERIEDGQIIKELFEAYNQDMLEHKNLFIYQNEKVIANFRYRSYEPHLNLYFEYYESMDHVKAVLEKYHIQMDNTISADEIEQITVWAYVEDEEALQETFGIQVQDKEISYGKVATQVAVETVDVNELQEYQAVFTKKEDIEELLDVVSMCEPYDYTLWSSYYVYDSEVSIELKNGDRCYGRILKGTMPKHLLEQMKSLKYE